MRPADRSSVLPLVVLLSALLVVDVLLLAGDWAGRNGNDAFAGWRWDVDRDGGWVELFRAVQLVAAAAVLHLVARRRRDAPVLSAWALTLVVIAVDDTVGLHERGGELLSAAGLPSVAGLTGQDLGEILVWAAMMVPLGLLLVLTYRRSSSDGRAAARWVAAGVALLALFAVVVDMAHAAVVEDLSYRANYLVTMVETGGQSAACGLVLVLALWIHRNRRPAVTAGVDRLHDDRTSADLAA